MPKTLRTALAAALVLACATGPSPKQRKTAEIHHDLGVEALRAGRAQEALREFDEALQNDERMPDAHLGRGLTLEFAFGRLDEAEKEYRRAIALRPGYSEAYNDLGQLLAKAGRYDEAVAAFDQALGNMLYKEPYVARCNKGRALFDAGRREDGIAELRACTAAAPPYCNGRRELGRALLDARRVKEALPELEAYARYCDKRADAHWQLGLAKMKDGDLDGARKAFQRCTELGEGTAEGEECRKSLALLEGP
jgi:type IV pilus assembly protein PilF